MISTGAGLALATISYTSNMQVASYVAGDSGWIAILTAGAICVLASLSFSELVGMFPTAAGIKLFIERAFGEKAALIFATIYVTISIAVVGSESYILANVLSTAFPVVPKLAWVFFFLTAIALINVRGIKIAGLTQDITTYSMFAALIGLSAYALFRNGFALTTPFAPGSSLGFTQAVAVGIFLYLGFEWVTPLAEEVTDFRLIPRGMLGAIGLLGVSYALFNVALTSTVDKSLMVSSPVPHVLFARTLLGPAGVMIMMLLSILASVTTFNAGVLTASRFIYALSRDRALPRFLSSIHPTYATPWVAVGLLYILSVGISLAVFFTGKYKVFIFLGAAIESMIYVVMAAAVIALRRREPARHRPFRIPGGLTFPLITGLLFAVLFVLVFLPDPTHPEDVSSQLAALIILLATFVLVSAYAWWGVPRLRAHYGTLARRRRRPRRLTQDLTGRS
ncbi:MAG: APC family permease [Firmicutes bacterium]|nr:APC family permease [Bacillota bacterium]